MEDRIDRPRDNLGHSAVLEAPQTSAADLETLFGAIAEGLILYAVDGTMIWANPAARAALGPDDAPLDVECMHHSISSSALPLRFYRKTCPRLFRPRPHIRAMPAANLWPQTSHDRPPSRWRDQQRRRMQWPGNDHVC